MSTFSIVGVTTGFGGSFYVAGNQTSKFFETVWFNVSGSTGNNGNYTVLSSSTSGPNTKIDVISTQSIPSSVANGQIIISAYRAYKITFRDPAKAPFYIDPQTISNFISIPLPGEGKFAYGEPMDKNLVHLMENFARNIPPSPAIEGQLWYDTSTGVLNIYDDSWNQVNATLLANTYVDVVGDVMTGALTIGQSVVTSNLEQHYNLVGNVGAGILTDSNLIINGNVTYPYTGAYPPPNTIYPSIYFKANGGLRYIIAHDTTYAQNSTDQNSLVIDRAIDNINGDLLIGSWSMNAGVTPGNVGMKVGIGALPPQYKLHVGSIEAIVAGFESQGTNSTSIRMYNPLSPRQWDIGVASTAHPTIPNKSFFINDVTGGTTSFVINTAGHIGVGVTAPLFSWVGQGIHINSIAGQSSGIHFTHQGDLGAGDGFAVFKDSNHVANMWQYENLSMVFGTANIERMRIGASGHVSINTLTSTANTLGIAAHAGANGIYVTGAPNQQAVAIVANGTSGQSLGLQILGGTNTADYALNIKDVSGAVDYLRVRGDGNVAIGNIASGAKLTVSVGNTGTTPSLNGGTAAVFQSNVLTGDPSRISIVSGASSFSMLEFGHASQVQNGNIYYDHSTNAMVFGTTSGVQRLRIDSAGKLILSKTGGADIQHNLTNDSVHISGSNSSALGSNVILFGNTHTSNANETHFRTDSNIRMKVMANGFVGINTPTPAQMLDVGGSIRYTNTLKAPDGTYITPSISFDNDPSVGLYKASSNALGIATDGTAEGSYRFFSTWIDMQSVGTLRKKIINLGTPTSLYDATTKEYVDGATSILTGTLAHGGTIPLPSGFTQSQCKWFVSINQLKTGHDATPAGNTIITSFCSADLNRIVSCYSTEVNPNYATVTNTGTVNYMIIGKK